MPPTTLTLRTLNRTTLARQMLLERAAMKPLAAIERLIGLQAQWPKPPFIGLWSRLAGFQRDDLAALLKQRKAVRATTLRGTLHVVSAKDYLGFRGVMLPMLTRSVTAILRERAKGLDFQGIEAAARSFYQGGPRTFDEVRDFLLTKYPYCDERALGLTARMLVPLVMEPTDAAWTFPSVSKFALAELWLGKKPSLLGDPQSLVLRYLAAFGPAGIADAQTWSGLQGLREVFETLRPKLRTYCDEKGRELFDLPDARLQKEDCESRVRFLPEFDNLILGHGDRTRFIAEPHRKYIFKAGLRVLPTLLVDGFAAATWKTEKKKKTAALVIESFGVLPKKSITDVEDEGERLIRFVEPDAERFEIRVLKAK